jgi:hypothetical protein
MRPESDLKPTGVKCLAELQARREGIAAAHPVVQGFMAMLRDRKEPLLDGWFERAESSGPPELRRFAFELAWG